MIVDELLRVPDPSHCCELMASLPYRLFLDSAAIGSRLGRYSFVTADPVALVRSKGAQTERIDLVSGTRHSVSTDALATVRSLLEPYRSEPVEGVPPFQGGAGGYIAYDWGLVLEHLPAPRHDDLDLDDVVLGIYDWVLAWDHDDARAWLMSTGIPETVPATRARRAAERAGFVREILSGRTHLRASRYGGQALAPTRDDTLAPARDSALAPTRDRTLALTRDRRLAPSYPLVSDSWDARLALRSSFTHSSYLEAVKRVREYIFAGDIFQANLSQRFEAPLNESPWELYRRLRARNAAPFAAFFELPNVSVLSASPERFLKVDRLGHVETRPIKGTRPRGVGPEHDAALGQALTESAKDRAENLMIVDLLRNDLSRVCAPGSVHVPELFALERYATVHHLVSTVVGTLANGTDASDVLRASFPGGSITGAPKLRAMEIIAELEPSQRGVYCGSIGYLSLTGELDTSIAIRTAVVRDGTVYFNAGGGIVADSDPEQEYRETLDKARGIIDSLIPDP